MLYGWLKDLTEGLELIELAKKKAPPPRQWNGKKKLPWPLAIYYKGQRYLNVEAYDLDNNWFKTLNNPPQYSTGGFLVQRLH